MKLKVWAEVVCRMSCVVRLKLHVPPVLTVHALSSCVSVCTRVSTVPPKPPPTFWHPRIFASHDAIGSPTMVLPAESISTARIYPPPIAVAVDEVEPPDLFFSTAVFV